MKCCSKEHLCIYRHIYIYISYVCVYIYISYVLSFFVYQIHIHLQSSTYRICVYWHNLHLDPGPPGILRISSSEAFRGRPSTSSATRKMGIFGIQSRENHGKTIKNHGKTRESMGEMGFSPKTMEKRWKGCDFWPKLKEGWPRKVVRGHKPSEIEAAQIRFPLSGDTIPSSRSLQHDCGSDPL